MREQKVASTIACLVTAARACEAADMWADQLTEEQKVAVTRRLGERQEWLARQMWLDRVRVKPSEKLAP